MDSSADSAIERRQEGLFNCAPRKYLLGRVFVLLDEKDLAVLRISSEISWDQTQKSKPQSPNMLRLKAAVG
jgi:hypothetical protein